MTPLLVLIQSIFYQNNHLNEKLKSIYRKIQQLDSAALIISIPALISGLWGDERRWHPWKKQLFRIQFYSCVCKYPNNYLQYSIKIKKYND